jgi:hypothetical protein
MRIAHGSTVPLYDILTANKEVLHFVSVIFLVKLSATYIWLYT